MHETSGMNILMVTGIFPPEIGGPASYIPRLASELATRHEISVVTLGEPEKRDLALPFKVIRVPRDGGPWLRRVRTVWCIRYVSKTADVILANGLFFETAIARSKSVPAVAKVVGDTVWERARNNGRTDKSLDDFQNGPDTPWLKLMHRWQGRCIASFNSVFTPSAYLEGIARKWGVPANRLNVIPNAVSVPARCEHVPEVDLVCVCRLVPWKGVMELTRLAVKEGWSLALVGDGPLRSDVETYLNKHPGHKVELRGIVPLAKVTNEIRRGKLFILNSSYEGLPHAVLEAQAAGVPVVATRAGGTTECIENGITGHLVNVGDDQHLKGTISNLLGNPLRRQELAEAALKYIQVNHDFDNMICRTEKLLMSAKSSFKCVD